MKDVNFQSITFIDGKNDFYDSFHDSDYGNIIGVKGLTLPKAIDIMKATKGINPFTNFKMTISVFYK